MRKLEKQNASVAGRKAPVIGLDNEGSWIKKHWLSVTLLLLVVLTVFVRTIFSYGLSAGSDFALSGAGAAEHKHTIESILMGTFGLSDPSLNYPYGGTLIQPPLVDMILAGFAWIVTLFGVSISTASAGVLAFSGPIAAAITVVLVYILGKEMFDRTIGLISALLFATLPLLVVTSVFSNGSGMGVVLMFFVIAMIFVVRAMKTIEKSERGIKIAFTKDVLRYTIPAGIMFAAIALSWKGFSMIIILLVFMMAASVVLLRLKNRDFSTSLGAYVTMILIAILVPLPYYVAAGLFTLVFTGPLLLSIISIVGALIFYVVRKKPIFQSFLIPIIVSVVIFAALYLVSPGSFNDVVLGNQIYETSLIASLLASSSISVSYMATFYGWATVWMPFVMITYMLYKFSKNNYPLSKLMTLLWVGGLFILSWLSRDNAVMAGAMYAIVASAVLVKLYRYIQMTAYFQSIRGGGWKASLKKFLKPEPFISLIAVLFLVIAPNAMLLADASTSSNRDNQVSAGYLGGIGYTVDTDDYNNMNMIWDEYYGQDKVGALVTWFENSSTAVDRGKFTSVTSDSGQGASSASNIMLAEGSAGALAAMALRMIIGEGVEKYQNNINIDAAVLAGVAEIINDPAGSKDKILKNPDIYPGVSADISDENAIYLVAIKYITDELTETEIYDFYNGIREESEGAIAYVALDASMIPLVHGDGSIFSAIAYLNDYELDSNGAATKYFSYGYSGVSYKETIFSSFLWKSLFGINKESGITTNLADLVFSDGTVKAQPGLGLTGFTVDYWYVKYNPDNDATIDDDGWVFMDGYEAIAKQKTDGGLINYFSSLVMMKVTDSDAIESQEGVITYGTDPMEGAKITVFEKDSNGTFVQRSTSFTDEDGNYSVKIPTTGADYEIRVYTATNKAVGGTYIGVITHPDVDYSIPVSMVSGTVEGYTNGVTLTAVGTYSGAKADTVTSIHGHYEFSGLPSDQYTITASLGTYTIGTQTVTIYPGANSGVDFGLSELIVTVKDVYGAPVSSAETVVIESKLTGVTYEQITADGIATFFVMPIIDKVANSGEYIVYVKDTISTSASVKVSSTAVTETKVTIYDTMHIAGLTGDVTVMAPGYSSSGTNVNVDIPNIGDSIFTLIYDGKVQTVTNGVPSGIELPLVEFTATLKSNSDKLIAGTVTFFGIVGESTEGLTMTYVAGDDGIIDAMLPEGDYVTYAVGNDGSCSISDVTVEASGTTDLTTDDGRKLTVTLTFSSGVDGSKGLAFRQVQVDVEVEAGVTKTIFGMTDSKGKAIITIPDNKAATVSIAAESAGEVTWNAVVNKEVTLGATDVSMSPLTTVVAKPMITGTGTSNTWLLKSLTSTPIKLSVPKEVAPGTYFCVEENDPGVYTYSKVDIYAGQTNMLVQPDTKVEELSLVNVETPDGATVTVEADPVNEDAVYYKINLLSNDNYLLESSNSYLFKAVKDDQISYIKYYGMVLDHTDFELKDKVTLKGYVGVDGDGTAWMTIGTISLFTEVKDGMYEVDVPAVDDRVNIDVKVKATPSGAVGKCDYVGTTYVDITEASKGTVITKSMQVTGYGTLSSVTDKLTVDVTNVSSTGSGTFTFDIEVYPAIDATVTKTYAVKAVGPWQLDKAYTVTVVGATSESITVNGTFDPIVIGDGNREMKVSLVDLSGTTKATGEITPGYVDPDTINTVNMIVAGESGASPDAVTDHEYLYAVTIRNDANYMMEAVFDVTIVGTYTGTYTVTDENGRIMDPDGSFPIAGKADTTLYVKLMKIDGEDIPKITVSAVITATDGTPEISGPTSYELESKAIELDSSLSIDGNNVYDEGSSPQTAFWVLLLMSVVMIVLVFWLGSKRGVFTRRK